MSEKKTPGEQLDEHTHLTGHQAAAIADANALLALSRRAGRQYALHHVMLGAAGAVTALLLGVATLWLALLVAAVIILTCGVALALFTRSHLHLVGQLNRWAGPFWIVWGIGLATAVVGAIVLTDHTWPLWLGGTLCLGAGLVVGHVTDRLSARATTAVPTTATH